MNNIEVSGVDNDQSVGGEVAMGEGEKPEARGAVISQSSKASICLVLKIKLVAELQMTSAPLLSHRRYHQILFGSHPNKIVNLPSL